ncbi:MAG TPA: hypothetical protein VND65_13550 [Candidatus Binatia bacterium]|nr:hypothetical protein [Candidatus Binatia bacterium]
MNTNPNLPVENGVSVPGARGQAENAATVLDRAVERPHSGLQLWLHRSSVFLFVLVSAIAGVLLVILPWTPQWTDNYLLLAFPWLRPILSSGFFRGLCSGLGLLDIWIGFWEALHYRERP